MFSFELYEHPGVYETWKRLEKELIETYQVPDIGFMHTMDAQNTQYFCPETKASLLPWNWDGNKVFWNQVMERLPSNYQVPDLPLLKRMFESI